MAARHLADFTPPAVIPAAPIDDYLSFALQVSLTGYRQFYTVDRYPLTLKTAFNADYNAGKAPSQAPNNSTGLVQGLKQGACSKS